jgi:hypothetical protein
MHTLDHVHVEPESKDQSEQVQVEATNPVLAQASPSASHQYRSCIILSS